MQGLINLNTHTLITIVFAVANIIPLSIVALAVYRRNSKSRINRLFTLGVLIQVFGFFMYPLGGILWDFNLFGIQVILVTQRLVLFSIFTSQLVILWISRILYDGEALWNRARNVLFIEGALLIITVALLAPDAVYIIEGPPEIDTGEGFWFSLFFYPSVWLLLGFSFLTFWRTYAEFHKDDYVIGRQSLMLSIGSFLNFIAITMMLLSLLLIEHSYMSLVYIFITVAIAIMSLGFTRDASLLKLKITSELRRLAKDIVKGRAVETDIQLSYVKELVELEESSSLVIRMLILESKVNIYQSQLSSAREILERAKSLAETIEYDELVSEINRHFEHLKIHDTATLITDTLQSSTIMKSDKQNLNEVMKYLEEMIASREGIRIKKEQ